MRKKIFEHRDSNDGNEELVQILFLILEKPKKNIYQVDFCSA
jgi:hypothetical protein